MDAASSRRLAEPVTLEDHVQGRFDAEITLVLYGDYECPYTRLSRLSVRALQREFAQPPRPSPTSSPTQTQTHAQTERLRFVFRHFPLEEIHPHARLAAAAAEAAAAQGEFWRMHDILFEHQKALEPANLLEYALDLGLD